MKLCTKCNKKFDSDSNFCDECGSQLIDFEIKYCSKCGAQCTSLDAFCKKCSNPLSGKQPPVQNQIKPQVQARPQSNIQPKKQTQTLQKSNNALLGAIIGVLAVILIVIIFIVVKLDLFPGSKSDTPDKFISSEQPEKYNSVIPENSENSDDTTDNSSDLSFFQDYYDSINDVFSKLIVSSSKKGELKSYKNSLKDAIEDNNADNCQYNYDKLIDLEKSLKDSSKSEIKKLTDKIKKYEKKDKCKKTKNGTEYKKNKELAQNALSNGDYVNANTYYKACFDALEKASKKKNTAPSSSASTSTAKKDDSWYENGIQDNDTFNRVYLYYLDPDEVSRFSSEEKRYYMNTLFAAYGYRFSNNTIQAFFNRQSWYSPDYNISVGNQDAVKNKFDDMCMYNYNLLK